jgi:hypothetical protein
VTHQYKAYQTSSGRPRWWYYNRYNCCNLTSMKFNYNLAQTSKLCSPSSNAPILEYPRCPSQGRQKAAVAMWKLNLEDHCKEVDPDTDCRQHERLWNVSDAEIHFLQHVWDKKLTRKKTRNSKYLQPLPIPHPHHPSDQSDLNGEPSVLALVVNLAARWSSQSWPDWLSTVQDASCKTEWVSFYIFGCLKLYNSPVSLSQVPYLLS